jgi:hypothetical protein
MNKKSLPEGELESITQSEDNEPIFKKVTNLFRPGFKRLTLVLWFLWFAHRSVQPIIPRIAPNELLIGFGISLGYYGLVLFTPQYFDLLSSSAWTVPAAPPTHAPSEEPISDEPIQLSPSSIVNDSSVRVHSSLFGFNLCANHSLHEIGLYASICNYTGRTPWINFERIFS